MALEPLHIAIDGPAGSGKSSVAAELARRLELTHVDTGALYRGLALSALESSIPSQDGPRLAQRLSELQLRFVGGRLHLNGVDRSEAIRQSQVTSLVSEVAAHAEVRAQMLRLQRLMVAEAAAGAVLEGRDIGSTVLPLARCKIYLDAQPAERARRRLLQSGQAVDALALEQTLQELLTRDRQDSDRKHSPLAIAPDAHVLDTSALSFESVLRCCADLARRSKEAVGAAAGAGQTAVADSLYRLVQRRLTRPLLRRLFGLEVHGVENERHPGSLIVACNHVSNFDPLVAGSALDREVWFMAKRELFFWPLGAVIRRFHAIPMERRRYDRVAFARAAELLAHGHSVVIFPEGTRRPRGRPGPIKRGLGILAMDSGRPYLPVFLAGSDRPGRALLRRERVRAWIGPVTQLHALAVLRERYDDSQVQNRIGALFLAQLQALSERAEMGERAEKSAARP